jgi:hypothetical protein
VIVAQEAALKVAEGGMIAAAVTVPVLAPAVAAAIPVLEGVSKTKLVHDVTTMLNEKGATPETEEALGALRDAWTAYRQVADGLERQEEAQAQAKAFAEVLGTPVPQRMLAPAGN